MKPDVAPHRKAQAAPNASVRPKQCACMPGITAATHSAKPVAGYPCSWSAGSRHATLGLEANLREERFLTRALARLRHGDGLDKAPLRPHPKRRTASATV